MGYTVSKKTKKPLRRNFVITIDDDEHEWIRTHPLVDTRQMIRLFIKQIIKNN